MNTETAFLVARKLFHNDNNNSTVVCPSENNPGLKIVPFVGTLTFHEFATILSGASAVVSSLISFGAMVRHALNYSSPVQQRQIIRIILLVPWISIFSFLIVWQDDAGEYLLESLDFGCAIAISAFLLLLCDYVLSNPGGYDELFGEGASKRLQMASGSPPWLKRTWYMVLQFIPTSIIIWIATAISVAVGTYCMASNSPHFAHIWITVFKAIVTGLAVIACLRFYGMKKAQLAPHKVMLKFFAFKGIIGLNFIQSFIINILAGNNTIKPSKYITYQDIRVGLPSLILACEMPIFAVMLFVAFPVSVYKASNQSPAASPITAIFQAFNITDLLSSFVRGPMRLIKEQQWGIKRQTSLPLSEDSQPLYQPPEYDAHRPMNV